MTRTLRYLLLFVLTGLSGSAFAQNADISGRVLDEKKEALISAVVQVYDQAGSLKGGAVTDLDGAYTVKPLEAGFYDVIVLYQGYDTVKLTGVTVGTSGSVTLNFNMQKPSGKMLSEVTVKWTKPLIRESTGKTLVREEIAVMPVTQVADVASTTAGVYQAQRGGSLNVAGARNSGTMYIIDGVQVRGNTGIDMPQNAIDQLEVITSGIPANYGDVSGGVVNITSRGVSRKLTGGFRLQHSIDGYNNNLGSFSIAGPLAKKKLANGDKKPVLGFSLSGDYYYDNDRYPFYDQQYIVQGADLKRLQENPLRISTGASGAPVYQYASEFATIDDMSKTKITPNRKIQEARVNGKLDYQLTDNMRIVGGGSLNYTKQDQYSRARNLFAGESTPERNTIVGRGYLRFTQKFGKSNDTGARRSIISNAYYTVQLDYQKQYIDQQDPKFKQNIFEYGYVGKFNETRTPQYFPNQEDSATGIRGTILTFSQTEKITFDRSEKNPILANYTSQLYNSLNEYYPQSYGQIQNSNGLLNGDLPKYTYGLFFSPGATQNAYIKFNSNQYALTVNASFDLMLGKTRHAIEFGLYYQQRIEKQYIAYSNPNGNGTQSLWSLMRQLVSNINNAGLILDKSNPIFRVNGQSYTKQQIDAGVVIPGPSDTILYNYKNVGNSVFDKNLRKKLGVADNYDIHIDEYDPSTYSLSMFSADELLNSGIGFVDYYGYSYTGQAQTGAVNFNDFWTKKDANGNYTRPIGAFSPNYIAGYILDKFKYKDMNFNVGVRVDRYSSNTKVLIDPYSLYPVKHVNEISGSSNAVNGGQHPANIGGNYVVYIDDNNASAQSVVGYRNGNSWYDPNGNQVSDPNVLKQYSGGRPIQPALLKYANGGTETPRITDTSFNPNYSFTDYIPQVTVQPRLSFNFPISEVADFYAHYDIYAQRPDADISNATPAVYYFLTQNNNQIINNPNLRSQKTFDYEVGFQQKLSASSALTITAFYKERKDQITVVPYISAWPTTYYTYGNRDFSTTKGTTLNYDLRATNHLRMNVAYTLQFAEGTGSTPTSTNGTNGGGQISPNGLLQSFIQAGLPNLRYVTPLTFDSRHIIAANIDYRYGAGEGPIVGGQNIFQRAGIDIIARARSGEPYTRYTDALGSTVIGGVAGSRLPWHFGVDLRIDKDFALNNLGWRHAKNAPAGAKQKRPLYLKGIFQVNNLLNTREVMRVYGYTGRPDDDGFLTSSYGTRAIPTQTNPLSYTQLYGISVNDPYRLNYHRTMSIALEFNF